MNALDRVKLAYNVLTQKQISHRPDLAGRVHIWSSMARTGDIDLQRYQDWAGVYMRYVWAAKVVGKTAQALSSKRVRVVDDEGEEIENHPLTMLLESVNDVQSSAEIWTSYFVNMLIAGESAFEIVDNGNGQPAELWHRRPDLLEIIPDEERSILFPKPASYRWGDSDTIIPTENIWHNKFFHPLNPWRGLAPIEAVRNGIVIDIFAQTWSKNFLQGGARPDYALISPEGTTKDERDQYLQQIMDQYSGSDNWHKPIVLEGGVVDIKELNFAPKDIEWLDQRKMSRDEVAAVFGMPDEIAGFGRDTYENFETAWRVWWLLTLKPLADHRDNSLQSFFTRIRPLLSPGQNVETDLTDVGVLQEDLEPKVKIAQRLFRMGVPFNTLDERLGLGIGEIPGGDQSFVSLSSSGAGAVEPLTEAAPVPVVKAIPRQVVDQLRRNAYGDLQRGRSPKVYFFDPHVSRPDSYKIATVLGHCRTRAEIDAVLAEIDTYIHKLIIGGGDEVPDDRMRDEREFVPEVQEFLEQETQRVFNETNRPDPKPPDNEFWTEEGVLLAAFLTPFVLKWILNGIGHSATVLSSAALGVDALVNAQAAAWANSYALSLAKGINATTRELARAKIVNFIQSGRPIQELFDELADVIGPRWRAELIAQTEVTRAWAEGSRRVAVATDGIKALVWQTQLDERVCPICGPLEGKKVLKKDGSFPPFPGGFTEPPAHPRCRCWLAFEV